MHESKRLATASAAEMNSRQIGPAMFSSKLQRTLASLCLVLTTAAALTAQSSTALSWRSVASTISMPPNGFQNAVSSSFTYDAARDVVIGFVTRYRSFDCTVLQTPETWERHRGQWIQVTASPHPAFGARLVYDETKKQVLAWDGRSVWDWNGSRWTAVLAATKPSTIGVLAYDRFRKQVVQVVSLPNALETWTWSGTGWLRVDSSPAWPGFAHLVWNNVSRGLMALSRSGDSKVQVWNGKQWATITVATGAIQAVAPHPSGRIIALTRRPNSTLAELEMLVGRRWIPIPGSTRASGIPQVAPSLIALPQGWLLICGSTERFDGIQWHNGIDIRCCAHDPIRDETIGFAVLNSVVQTFSFDGRSYHFRNTPTTQAGMQLVWHPSLQAVVGVESYSSRLRAFRGGSWREIATKGTLPSPVDSLTYDTTSKTIVMMLDNRETWEWDRRGGFRRTHSAFGHVSGGLLIAYDRRRKKRVLWDTASQTIREWNSGVWKLRATTNSLPGRAGGPFVYDPQVGGIVLLGTLQRCRPRSPYTTGFTYVYDGRDWSQVPGLRLPDVGGYVVRNVIYDTARRSLRVFTPGGFGKPGNNDVRELGDHSLRSNAGALRPGQTWTLRYDNAQKKGLALVLGLSEKFRPGLPLRRSALGDVELLPLAPGALLDASLAAGLITLLDARGRGTIKLPLPTQRTLLGLEIFAAGILVNANGIESLTRHVSLFITR